MTDNTTPATEPATASLQTDTTTDARSVRAETVTWGAILLSIAALFFAGTQLDLAEVNGGIVLAWSALGLGAVLVIGGLVAAIFRKR